jgi:hypothetical protein
VEAEHQPATAANNQDGGQAGLDDNNGDNQQDLNVVAVANDMDAQADVNRGELNNPEDDPRDQDGKLDEEEQEEEDVAGEHKCDIDGCDFAKNNPRGVAIHKGRKHKN